MLKPIVLMISTLSLIAAEPNFGTFDGTAVIIDLNSSAKTVYGSHTDERMNPCSTFKILNTMIALDSGAVKDENETVGWDGIVRDYSAWNHDQSMRTALPVSAVWFYQEMARRVGAERMQVMVTKAAYGNMDTSHTITDFWLGGGSLNISPIEQAEFLEKLVRDQLPFSVRSMRIVKDIMTLEKKEDYTMAGKTGSCGGIGWFVGFVEESRNTRVFAFEIRGNGASGTEAKKIALNYIKGEH